VLRLTGRRRVTPPPTLATPLGATQVEAALGDQAAVASPIDVARGLRNWGDRTAYAKYLRHFASSHGKDGEAIACLLTRGKSREAGALLHRLRGAAGNMALMPLSGVTLALEQTIKDGADPAALVLDLQRALDEAGAAIDAFVARAPDETVGAPPAPDESTPLPRVFENLLRALGKDNPDDAEDIVEGLSGRVAVAQLAALRECLEGFDFRGAEAMVRSLEEVLS
jgi:HPt (histidine-containing phosphotransfer) domain-containing protein